MSAHGLSQAEVWAWWCEQSAAQGLPPEITDPVVLSKVITLAFAGEEPAKGRGRRGG